MVNPNIVDVLTYLCANRSNWACVLSFPSLDARALDGRRTTVIETTRIESRSIIDLISCILYVYICTMGTMYRMCGKTKKWFSEFFIHVGRERRKEKLCMSVCMYVCVCVCV